MDFRSFIDFMAVAERLKCNTRHSWTSTGRHESVAEHCWRLAVMAAMLRDEFPEADMDRVVKMCLFHDLGEAVTGDIPAFEKSASDERSEDILVDGILDGLPEPVRTELQELFAEMRAQRTVESRIYKALDKMEAVLQHNEADLSTWLPLEYDMNLDYGASEASFSPYLRELRAALRSDSLKKIAAAKNG